MDADGFLDTINSYIQRFWRVASVLIDMHLDIATQEARQERNRILIGTILLLIGTALLTMATILLQVFAVWFAYDWGLSWPMAILAVAGADLLIGFLLMAIGARRLSGPYMIQTQARLSRTTALLSNRYPSQAPLERQSSRDRI